MTVKLVGIQFDMIGVNHNTAPVAVRELLAVSSQRLPEALGVLRSHLPHGVIISTCNRTEVYAANSSGHSTRDGMLRFLEAWSDMPVANLSPYIYVNQNESAVAHLFKVAAGLDSMIVGEYEILGQVKQSLDQAEKAGLVDMPLQNLFRSALKVGRRVREETGISRNALSVSSVAVDLAAKTVGDLSRCSAILIGTGEAGRLVAKALKERGVSRITVASRSMEKASSLAGALGGGFIAMSRLHEELRACDIGISCTGAPHQVIALHTVEEAIQSRPGRPLVLIDIAVPRDIDPEVARLENVFLYDIDALVHLSEANRQQREAEVAAAAEIIRDEVERFTSWHRSAEVRPLVTSLVNKAEEIRRRQLAVTLKRLRKLSPEEQESLDAMTRAIVQKILHDPIRYLKNNSHREEACVSLVNKLFNLDRETPG